MLSPVDAGAATLAGISGIVYFFMRLAGTALAWFDEVVASRVHGN